jgi:small neutral amino acid transporter SnatA (MarC family)
VNAVIGIVLILFGAFTTLFPQRSAESTAQTQRRWIAILPWLKPRDPNNDWMTDVGYWRVLSRVGGVIMVVVGVRFLTS